MSNEKVEPWQSGYRSYAGWIPNIRSHLSFSLIGAARDARSFTQHCADTRSRIVLVLQNRVINDYPLPAFIAKRLFPDIEGRWFMDAETASTKLPVRKNGALDVETDRQGLLQGTVRFLPLQEDDDAHARMVREMAKGAELLTGGRLLPDCDAVRDLRDSAARLIGAAGRSILYEFALMRTGECRLWYSSEVEGWTLQDHDRLAEQAYYFIKDMVHDHTHHDPTSDQITPLIYFDPASVEEGHEDEVKWRRETMWALSREVERLNRGGNLVDQHRALGIIAYAEEFQAALMSHVRDPSAANGFRENTTVHDFEFNRLKASIKAQIDVKSANLSQRVQKWIATAAIFVSTLALISSLVSTHNAAILRGADGKPKSELIALGSLDWFLPGLAAEPIVTAGLVAICLMSIISSLNLGGTAVLYNRAQRVLSQSARAFAVTFSVSTAGQRFVATLGNLLIGLLALGICYIQFRFIGGGGQW